MGKDYYGVLGVDKKASQECSWGSCEEILQHLACSEAASLLQQD